MAKKQGDALAKYRACLKRVQKDNPKKTFAQCQQIAKKLYQSGAKVSGAKPKAKKATPRAAVKPARVVSGAKRKAPAGGSFSAKGKELLSIYRRIDHYEQLLRSEKRVGAKKELINKINRLEDKKDSLKASMNLVTIH